MRIFLIGFMGSGITTIGRQLSAKLGYRFLDMDEEIQNQFHLKVSQIFEKYGEQGFRQAEKELISKTREYEDIVISTGGGAPCFFNNLDTMNLLGITIYLKTEPKTLSKRLKGSQQNRPLLKDKTEAELLQYVKDKLVEREPFYKKAKHTIEAIDIKVQDIITVLSSSRA